MKKKILSMVLMLALALSLAIGTAVVSNAATEGYLETGATLTENIKLQVKFDLTACESATVKVGDKDAVDVTENTYKQDGKVVVPVEIAVKDVDKALVVTASDGENTYTKSTLENSTDAFTAAAYLAGLDGTIYENLAETLTTYAGVAKQYFAGATLTAPQAPATTSKVATTGSLTGIVHRSVTLVLESETTIRHYFEGDITGYTFTVGSAELTPEEKDGRHYVDIAGITPKELDDAYTLTVTNGTDNYTYTYSALDYVDRAFNNGGSDNRKAISAELYNYWNAAENVKGTITYNANGGTMPATYIEEFVPGGSIKTPTPTKSGSVFAGWYTDAACTENASHNGIVNSDTNVNLYAKWVEKTAFETLNNQSVMIYNQGTNSTHGAQILANEGYLTLSYKLDSSKDTSGLSGFWNATGGPGDTSANRGANWLSVLYVDGDGVYSCVGSNKNSKSTHREAPIASYAAGDTIDVVIHYELNGTKDNITGKVTLQYYVNGILVDTIGNHSRTINGYANNIQSFTMGSTATDKNGLKCNTFYSRAMSGSTLNSSKPGLVLNIYGGNNFN